MTRRSLFRFLATTPAAAAAAPAIASSIKMDDLSRHGQWGIEFPQQGHPARWMWCDCALCRDYRAWARTWAPDTLELRRTGGEGWLRHVRAPMDGRYMVTYSPGRYRIMSMKAGEEVDVAHGIVYMGPIDPDPRGPVDATRRRENW